MASLYGGDAPLTLSIGVGTPGAVQGVRAEGPMSGPRLAVALAGTVLMSAGGAPLQSPYSPPAPASGAWIKVAGVWKNATVWIKVAGVWKTATPFVKAGGVWH